MCNIYPGKLTFYCSYPEKMSTMIDMSGLSQRNPDGVVSQKANKRIRNAIDWLLHLSKEKEILYKNSNKKFQFKINFITLTLPSSQLAAYQLPCGKIFYRENLSLFVPAYNVGFGKFIFKNSQGKKGKKQFLDDNYIKKNLLNQFLTELRQQFNVTHYVWRAEAQKNGNLHFHITTSKFIYWKKLRTIWNRILDKTSLIDDYQKKFQHLDFDDYCQLADPFCNKSYRKLYKAFQYGEKTNWRDPNTIDVHSVKKAKNISAYMGKYFAKENELRRHISGKLWRLSYSLSKLKSIAVEVSLDMQNEINFLKKKFKNNLRLYEHASILYTNIIDIFNSIKNSKIISTFRYYRDFVLNIPSFDFPKNEYLFQICNWQLISAQRKKERKLLFEKTKIPLAVPISELFPVKKKELLINFT